MTLILISFTFKENYCWKPIYTPLKLTNLKVTHVNIESDMREMEFQMFVWFMRKFTAFHQKRRTTIFNCSFWLKYTCTGNKRKKSMSMGVMEKPSDNSDVARFGLFYLWDDYKPHELSLKAITRFWNPTSVNTHSDYSR
jgi:hypothetical protein